MLAFQKQVKATGGIYSSLGVKPIATPFSWKKECREIFSLKFFGVIWWPLFTYRQRYFTRTALFDHCKALPGFQDLWTTIQKGSFAYNHLFLGIKPYQSCSSATHLADITTLTLFFGDEFIDGVCKEAGKECIRDIVNNDPQKFYLKKRTRRGKVELYYAIDPGALLPASVMQCTTPKYGISYKEFYQLLEQFLDLMNEHLAFFSTEKALQVADKIMDVCNNCLESYLNDVNGEADDCNINDVDTVLFFHERKTSWMQEKLLELRCLLAGKMEVMKSSQAKGWLDIMRVVQICDDLQDVMEDEGFQDNLVISVAFHKFHNEWKWMKANREALVASEQRELLLSLNMPRSIHYCLRLASGKIKKMNWEQQKIMHYILFKNWFGETEEDTSLEQDLAAMYRRLSEAMPGVSEQAVKAYFVDTCFHIPSARRMMRKKLSGSVFYQLRYNLLSVSGTDKLKVFDELIPAIS